MEQATEAWQDGYERGIEVGRERAALDIEDHDPGDALSDGWASRFAEVARGKTGEESTSCPT